MSTTANDEVSSDVLEDVLNSIKVLHPSRYYTSYNTNGSYNANAATTSTTTKQRFSSLLLEYGEREVHDWAVVASSSQSNVSSSLGNPTAEVGSGSGTATASRSRSSFKNSSSNTSILTSSSTRNVKLGKNYISTMNSNRSSSNNADNNNGSTRSIFRAHNHLSFQSYSSSSSLSISSSATTGAVITSATQDDVTTNGYFNVDKPIKLKPFGKKKKRSKSKRDKLSSSSSQPSSSSLINNNMATVEGTNAMKRVQGRLYLCTKSIVFEPDDISKGIIRCPFDKMTIKPMLRSENKNNGMVYNHANGADNDSYIQQQKQQQKQQQTITFTTTKYIIMKKNNIIKPYTVIDESNQTNGKEKHNTSNRDQSSTATTATTNSTTFSFTFLFSKPTQFLNICNIIHQNPKLNFNSRLSFTNNNNTAHHHHQQQQQQLKPKFNLHNLNHLTETPQTASLQSYVLSPLMSKAGCTMITDQYLYFQPINGLIGLGLNGNNINNNNSNYDNVLMNNSRSNSSLSISTDHVKVSSWKLSSIIATARRYHGLKDSALELFFHKYDNNDSNKTSSRANSNKSVHDNIENMNYGNGNNMNNGKNYLHWQQQQKRQSSSGDDKSSNVHSSSLLIAFESRKDREKVMALLPKVRYVSDTSSSATISTDNINDDNIEDDIHQCPQSYEYNNNLDDLTPKMKKKIAIKVYCHTDSSFIKQVMKIWMKGQLSNFDYLLALNSAAGRSFHDLSRYPVFPWVLNDYESQELKIGKDVSNTTKVFRDLTKPIGALNQERLTQFQERWKSMQDMEDVASFLYGTHYSAPGYCLYYLVRLMPEHMLCLQNGKYDTPDRLFHSIQHCYSSLLTNPADLKESIPQFYDPRTGVDLLLNLNCLQLGVTQNGTIIDDVELPAWAKSPKDFLKKNRMALESKYCTKHLPDWIDLIFGDKSRGPKAEEALNVFHPTSYLGPEDVNKMDTQEKKMQAELQATEFGICPDILFSAPHPQSNGNVDDIDEFFVLEKNRPLDSGFYDSFNYDDKISESKEWELLSKEDGMENVIKSNEDIFTSNLSNDNIQPSITTSVEYVSTDEKPRNLNNEDFHFIDPATNQYEHEQDRVRTRIPLSGSGDSTRTSDDGFGSFGARSTSSDSSRNRSYPLSKSISQNRHETAADRSSLEVNSNSNWNLVRIVTKQIHSDAVSGCHISVDKNKSNITTTSLDGSLMVNILPNYNNSGRPNFPSRNDHTSEFQPTAHLHPFRSHTSDDPLACLSVIVEGEGEGCGQIAFAGGHDDVIFAYGVNSACGLASVYSHRDAITGIDLLANQPYGKSGISLDGTHIMISGSWDATVKLWNVYIRKGEVVTIDKDPLVEMFDTDSSISNIAGVYGVDGRLYVAAGCTDGGLTVWCWDGRGKSVKYQASRKGFGSCSSVHWVQTDKTFLFAGFGNGKMTSYLLTGGEIYPVGALDIGSSVHCLCSMNQNNNVLLGCEDGGVRLIKFGNDGHLDHEPVLFPSVAGRNSAPVSTIHATSVYNRNTSRNNEIIGVIGGKDGSVTIFNLYEC